jgi:hypothetical protein
MAEALTNWEVQEFVYDWFRKLTDKVPAEELLAMLSDEGLEMQSPEETLRSHADFKKWLDTVTHLFFDQVHDVKLLAVDLAGDQATVNLIVNWQARTWTPPAPYSEWQGSYVHQNWTVKRSPTTGKPVIVNYKVGAFDPMQTFHEIS